MTLRAQLAGRLAFPLGFNLGRSKLWPDASVHDGISFSAATGLVAIKAPGGAPSVQSLTSAFTFTSGNQGYFRNRNGVLVPSVTNSPRVEYDANGAVLGLLMEASRTNVALNSADLSAGTWTKSQCTIGTANSADGTVRNTRIIEDNTTNIHGIIAGVAVTANSTYCLSAIVRPAGRQFCFLYGTNVDQFGAIFDFVNLTSAQIISGTSTINQRGIIPWGGGRFLVWVSGVLNAASTVLNFVGGPATSLSVPSGYTYAGDNTSGVEMEFIQIELGAFPSSRILTAGTAVARTADVCIRTLGTEFSATAGTMVVQGRASGGQDSTSGQCVYTFDDTTLSNRVGLVRVAATDSARLNSFNAGVSQFALDATFTNLSPFKASAAWAANDVAFSFNGAAPLAAATLAVPTMTRLSLGNGASTAQGNCHIRSFDYYPTRLDNATLQRLAA